MSVRANRWLIRLCWVIVALIVGVFLIGWFFLSASLPRLSGLRSLPGLSEPVTVERDARGTVTVTGATRDDVTYALGYLHGQERYFGMDLMRRLAAGELSELVGSAALQTDLNHRRHRLRAVTETAYAQLPASERQQIDHYRDGVNAGLSDLRVRPWEYLLLGVKPRPWRSEDSLLVIAAMYLDLNNDGLNERELRISQLRAVLPDSVVDFLLAPDPDWEAPLKGSLSPAPTIPSTSAFDMRRLAVQTLSEKTPALIVDDNDNARVGSNSFAVSGTLGENGDSVLASDMHLGLRVPDIWFRARLRYPDTTAPNEQRDVNGLTLPGTPALVVGSNGQIAWAFTNSYGDWLDWVRVQRDPHDSNRYKVPEGWASFDTHHELIQVKGASAQSLDVSDTRWGPIMATDVDGTPLALAWIAQQPRGYNLNLMKLERASSSADAISMAPTLGMPPQNMVVADDTGHIGWTIAGNSIPLRAGITAQQPSDWSTRNSGWVGWANAASYPRDENPADGRLWTANNRTVGGSEFTLLGNGGPDLGARAKQIRDDLFARDHFAPGDLLGIQLDDRALFLARWQVLLQQTLSGDDDPALQSLRTLTATWHGHAAVDSVDFRLVRTFRTQVQTLALAPFVSTLQKRYPDFSWTGLGNPEAALWLMVTQQPANLLNPNYPNWHALLLDAAHRVAADLSKQPGGLAARRWGEINRARIEPPLARALPALLKPFFDMPDDELPGDSNMPRVATPDFGASERLDVSPGHEAQGILEMPGGQSDNPLSPYYGAGHEDWVKGRPTPLLPGVTLYRMTLLPTAK